MNFSLTKFAIHNLHGDRNISLAIDKNSIIMVGVNGLGKTTIVNLLYLTLSRQWDRATEYNFSAIEFELNGESHVLTRKANDSRKSRLAYVIKTFSKQLSRPAFELIVKEPDFHRIIESGYYDDKDLYRLSVRTGVPLGIFRRMFRTIASNKNTFEDTAREKADDALKACLQNHQILYLPTYRRIEKDFQLIFPELEEDIQRYNQRRLIESREGGKGHIELVEFGMEDVENTFHRIGKELSENARTQVTNLAGSYLRDVIRGDGDTYNPDSFKKLEEPLISKILNRVELGILSEEDKILLQKVIHKIKYAPDNELDEKDKYVAHYFSKLISVHDALTTKELLANSFTRVCNKYLSGKKLMYNEKTYEISVATESGRPLLLRNLSSGEKQIVSLFSHLYLQREGDLLVLIDEPELSLSVEWQKSLLPDIIATGRCQFLAAVTHSPFIFDNDLDGNVVDIAECVTRTQNYELS
ncbi:MAG: AAA family ATPase [Isosphaeraceae bacterium]